MVKNSPLVYMSYPEPYCFIIWTDISYLELFWALPNGEFVRGRCLSSTNLSPLCTHCFASLKCLACQSPTTGIDIHLCQIIPITTKTQNLHSEPIHLEWSIQAMLPSKNSIIMECGSSSLKKLELKQWKKNKTHTSTQKSWNKGLKRPKFTKCESISSLSPEHFTFHKIGIWSSANLLGTTIRLGNIGN